LRLDAWAERDVDADFKSIAGAKRQARRKRLDRLRPHIIARYWQYWLARSAPETVHPRKWSDATIDAMQHCYNGSSQSRNTVLDAIETAVTPTPFLCPYCLIRQPASFDHFLPKDAFPEFAVLAWNLILVCNSCNLRKGNRFVGQPRHILNPYFDPIPETALLHAEIVIDPDHIRIHFFIDTLEDEVPNELLALAERHITALGLKQNLMREGSTFISSLIQAFAAAGPEAVSAESLAARLDERMAGFDGFPVNYWQAAVIAALESDPNLLAYVNARITNVPRPTRLRPPLNRALLRLRAKQVMAVTNI
jgi:5-methylcytosine-specific restriction endonuclease McrA